MLELNLPRFNVKMRKHDKVEIWDRIRKKYVVLTPEEWVRQHFVNYLIIEKKYPENLISNEVEIKLKNVKKRCDTIVYNTGLNPIVLAEYKAPTVRLNPDVFDQIVRYNMVLKVGYLIISNGIEHYCCKIDYNNMSYTCLNSIPSYSEILRC